MKKSLYILGDLIDEDIIFLADRGEVLELSAEQTLITAGEEVTALYFVTHGALQVMSNGASLAELGVGDVVGEMSFVESQPPDASVIATEPARVLAVPRDVLLAELESNPSFAGRFYKALATFLSDRLRSMTARGAEGELDDRLLDIMHVAGDRMLRLIDMLESR